MGKGGDSGEGTTDFRDFWRKKGEKRESKTKPNLSLNHLYLDASRSNSFTLKIKVVHDAETYRLILISKSYNEI